MRTASPLFVVAGLVLAGCGSANAELAAQRAELERLAADPEATRVEVATLAPSEARLTLDLPGEVEGGQDVLLASAAGGLVERVLVDAGDSVRKGALLLVIDGTVRDAQLKQAEAQAAQARSELERLRKLGDLATEQALVGASTQLAVAEASVDLARAQRDRAYLRAPFDGVIGALDVSVGEVVAPSTPVARVVDLDPVTVKLSVADRDVVALAPDQHVQVRTPATGTLLPGRVSHISPVADLKTRAFVVEVEVANDARSLLPGMIARVSADRQLRADAIVLPQDWVVTRLDGYGVYVQDGDVARWRPISLGAVIGSQVLVSEGLAEGDRVIITGQHDLADGDALLVAREGTCCTSGRAVF